MTQPFQTRRQSWLRIARSARIASASFKRLRRSSRLLRFSRPFTPPTLSFTPLDHRSFPRRNLLGNHSPCGHLAGLYAQTDAARGVWIAPTNVFLSGVTALSQDLTPAEANALNSLGVDVIQNILGRGITVTGDRTTRQDSDYQFTAARCLMISSSSRSLEERNGPSLSPTAP